MFGFLIGTLCLIGFVKVWKHGRHGGRGGPRRWMLRRLFQRLDTTPGQEKVILEAVDAVEREAHTARRTLFDSRAQVAASLRGERFDTAAFDDAAQKQKGAVESAQKTVKERLMAVHEALNAEQRTQVADLLERGPARFAHGGHGCHGQHAHAY